MTLRTSLTPRPHPPPPPPPPPPRFARPRRAAANQGTPISQWSACLMTSSRIRRAGRAGGLHLAHGGIVDGLEAREVEIARGLRGVLQLNHLRTDLELGLNCRPARLLLLQGLSFARAQWCVASGRRRIARGAHLQLAGEVGGDVLERSDDSLTISHCVFLRARARQRASLAPSIAGQGARRAAHHQKRHFGRVKQPRVWCSARRVRATWTRLRPAHGARRAVTSSELCLNSTP